MSNIPRFLLLPVISAIFIFSAASLATFAADFSNPVLKIPFAGCSAENLQLRHFDSSINMSERLKMCQALEKITYKLNSTSWSPALSAELKGIWQIFSNESVTLRSMPNGTASRVLAMAEAFPEGTKNKSGFEASVYLRPEKSDSDSFFQVLMHELRHVYDFYYTWNDKTALDSLEIERRAFLLMGKLTEESRESASGVPKFWKESWRKLPINEATSKRSEAVDKYLQKNSFYRQLSQSGNRQALDFSFRNAGFNKDDTKTIFSQNASFNGERLPTRPTLPKTSAVLPQQIRQADFHLEKPRDVRSDKEILQVALRNEKKLYYGMSNFVYDQKLQFQCWKKGKVSTSFSASNVVARTTAGHALIQQNNMPPATNAPCAVDSENLKTDFTETFWASPALEKMPIRFAGFTEVEGKTLARYTVLPPSAQLFEQLTKEFGSINPFRVFVGTIFVSPEDGQIVKFWGTSFPEETVTGTNSGKVWGNYSVTAVRQKLNIENGLWVTVYVGTAAVANIKGNSRPFSYSVNLENYRQSVTDVRILDDELTAVNSYAASR